MVWGYFKKLVIADRLVVVVNEIFTNYDKYAGGHYILASVFGAIQLYCDFSGCMDIAGGFSQTLGIELENNFNHPFFSKNAAEFWCRWYIALGTWFKDYVYMHTKSCNRNTCEPEVQRQAVPDGVPGEKRTAESV